MSNHEKTIKYCPVELSLELITKKWVIQIIRDMLFGKTHFNEFKENKPELSNKVLSRCLKQMEEDGLINKHVDPDDSRNTEYSLTEKGQAMNKIVYELAMYTVNTDKYNRYFDDESKTKIRKMFQEKLKLNDDITNRENHSTS